VKTGTLYQYRGGGYDGCFWEWNYFFIDAEGRFFNIAASGWKGIRRAEDAESVTDDPHTHTYDVSNDEEMAAFARESNPVHVVGVARWFLNNQYGYAVKPLCERCGSEIDPFHPHFGDYRGEGGIVISPHEIYCENCVTEDDT